MLDDQIRLESQKITSRLPGSGDPSLVWINPPKTLQTGCTVSYYILTPHTPCWEIQLSILSIMSIMSIGSQNLLYILLIEIEIAEEVEEMGHESNINTVVNDSARCLNGEVDQSGFVIILWLLTGALLFLLCLLVYNLWLGSRQNYTSYIDPTYYLQY